MSVKIFFNQDGKIIEAKAEVGETLLEVAHNNDEVNLFGGCGGAGVCGTCHVLIEERYLEKDNLDFGGESSILEILPNKENNSRLACQVIVTEEMDGMTVTIPS